VRRTESTINLFEGNDQAQQLFLDVRSKFLTGMFNERISGLHIYQIEYPQNDVPDDNPIIPSLISLKTYPNPFNSSMSVNIQTPVSGEFKLQLFNSLGRSVYEKDVHINKNGQTFTFNANNLPSGYYFIKASNKTGESIVRKVTLLK